jgi:hypothetical protein
MHWVIFKPRDWVGTTVNIHFSPDSFVLVQEDVFFLLGSQLTDFLISQRIACNLVDDLFFPLVDLDFSVQPQDIAHCES